MRAVSSADLRKDLTTVLAETQHSNDEVVITRSGQPVAILIGTDRWEEIQFILSYIRFPRAR